MADVIQIRDLRVYLEVDAGTVKAVDGVSFRIPEGGTVALEGESGSGKTMVAQAVMSILPRVARIESGEILFHDPRRPGEVTDIARLHPDGSEVRAIRGGRISIIFQEPMTALSPLHTVHSSDVVTDRRGRPRGGGPAEPEVPGASPLPAGGAPSIVVNVYGSATTADAEKVVEMLTAWQRRNGPLPLSVAS